MRAAQLVRPFTSLPPAGAKSRESSQDV
jgi:hypothetical protein